MMKSLIIPAIAVISIPRQRGYDHQVLKNLCSA